MLLSTRKKSAKFISTIARPLNWEVELYKIFSFSYSFLLYIPKSYACFAAIPSKNDLFLVMQKCQSNNLQNSAAFLMGKDSKEVE